MPKKTSNIGDNPEIILCKKSQRFENIVVCTYQCFDRCVGYKEKFRLEIIQKYIETHPDYEMKGVIMPVEKKTGTASKSTKEKIYWIFMGENQVNEITETEIINNPAEYIGKPMYEKPRDQYEILVTIRKKSQ